MSPPPTVALHIPEHEDVQVLGGCSQLVVRGGLQRALPFGGVLSVVPPG